MHNFNWGRLPQEATNEQRQGGREGNRGGRGVGTLSQGPSGGASLRNVDGSPAITRGRKNARA